MSRTSQSESIFHVNEGVGPSHMSSGEPADGMSLQSSSAPRTLFVVNEGAGPSHMSFGETAGTSSQRTVYSYLNQRQGLL